jgi:hypothetical protein
MAELLIMRIVWLCMISVRDVRFDSRENYKTMGHHHQVDLAEKY